MELIAFQKARLEKNKLHIDESTSIEEWKELGQLLKQVEGSVQFWIGDWARFGEKKGFTGKYVSPETYNEIEDITGINRKTIQNYKSVSDNVKSSRRRENLSFSHHSEVSSLSEEDQDVFLEKAINENMSAKSLRKEVKTYKGDKHAVHSLNDRIAIEKDLIAIAKELKSKYTKEQLVFLIIQINK